ncbi:MAG: TlpA family protein disulfide reductase [Actinomycetota bacterium]|nr:TlpA family protein disulfide reductase [Actinomycetota bacterium]
MTRRLIGLALVTAMAAVVAGILMTRGGDGAATPEASAGVAVPAQSFEMFDGSTASLADYGGRPLVVNFWASWCPPCVAEMPDLERVHQQLAGQVVFLGINTQDTPDRAVDLATQTGVTYDLARDPAGELFQAFGVFGMPSTFFVSAEGEIVDRHTGIITAEMLLERIERVLLTAR